MQNYCDIIIISQLLWIWLADSLSLLPVASYNVMTFCGRVIRCYIVSAVAISTSYLTYLIRTHLTGSIELIILIRIEIFIKWLALLPIQTLASLHFTLLHSIPQKMKLDFPRAMFNRGIFDSPCMAYTRCRNLTHDCECERGCGVL